MFLPKAENDATKVNCKLRVAYDNLFIIPWLQMHIMRIYHSRKKTWDSCKKRQLRFLWKFFDFRIIICCKCEA